MTIRRLELVLAIVFLLVGVGVALAQQSAMLSVSPTASMETAGEEGGPFAPPAFTYQLRSSRLDRELSWRLLNVPAWLTPSASRGETPADVTFTVNAAANAMLPGLHDAIISFAARRGTTQRAALLTVVAKPPPPPPEGIVVSQSPIVFNSPDPVTVTVTTSNGANWTSSDTCIADAMPYQGAPSGVPQTITPNRSSWDALPTGQSTCPIVYSAPGLPNLLVQEVYNKPAPPPPPPPECTVGQGSFTGCYFSGDFSTLLLVRNDGYPLAFDWAEGSPAPAVPADHFSAMWLGWFAFNEGTHRFTAVADDGVRLFVNGEQVIDAWVLQGPTTYRADVALLAGQHLIEMQFFENDGGATAMLSWERLAPPPMPGGFLLDGSGGRLLTSSGDPLLAE